MIWSNADMYSQVAEPCLAASNCGKADADRLSAQPQPKPSLLHNGSAPSPTVSGSRSPRVRRSPEGFRRNSSGLLSVPEDSSNMNFERLQGDITPRYADSASLDSDEEEEEEVEEWLLDEELAKEGLYRGSYARLMALNTLVPLSSISVFVLLAMLPRMAYPLDPDSPHSPYPYAPYLPYPLPELLTSAALWSMSQLLREFIFSAPIAFSASSSNTSVYLLLSILSTITQTFIFVLLQLCAIALLLITPDTRHHHPTWHDHAFRRVWAVALGWAGAEAIVGIKQGYENITLYRDVLVTVRKVATDAPVDLMRSHEEGSPDTIISLTRTSSRAPRNNMSFDEILEVDRNAHRMGDVSDGERRPLLPRQQKQSLECYRLSKSAIEMEVENDLEQLVALKSREELEEVYGMPVICIPVFISCLHRINAVLISLGSFLLLSAAYLRSDLAPSRRPSVPVGAPSGLQAPPLSILPGSLLPHLTIRLASHSNTLLALTFLSIVACQSILAILHTAWVLPKIGVHTFVYIGILVSLGMLFAGLGYWEALV